MEVVMTKRLLDGAALLAAAYAGYALAQYPILDRIAEKAIDKYQSSSCQQLWQAKGKPHTPEEQKAVEFLRTDPQRRAYFLNKVAGPIANKMFECGVIP
jgi:hypothetical protein